MKCAVAQVASGGDVARNLKVSRDYIQKAADAGAKLVLFPEVAMAATFDPESTRRVAEPLDGPYLTAMRQAAREGRLHVVTGMLERDGADVFNTEVVIDESGEVIRTYRKVHLFDALHFRESDGIKAGSEMMQPFSAYGFTFGLVTCYELRFPEWLRLQVLHGANVLLNPAAWQGGPFKDVHWSTLARARAIENTCYFLACSMTGPGFNGHSAIFDPFGTCLGEAADREALVTADLSLERLREVEEVLPWRSHQRPDIYRRSMPGA